MDTSYKIPDHGGLRGRAVLLSASVPSAERADIYRQIQATEEIEEAVISLARAVFSEGGTLVFGGHPKISPLVAQVVREYLRPRVAERFHSEEKEAHREAQVEIYQSEAYRKLITEAAQRLEQQPGVEVHWVTAASGEMADPDVKGRAQVPQSLLRMRAEMIRRKDLAGMVCIGGMEGVEAEAALMHEYHPNLPIYVLGSTGGAAGKLAQVQEGSPWLRNPERGVQKIVEKFWQTELEREQKESEEEGLRRKHAEHRSKGEGDEGFVMPYGYVMQQIVADLIRPEQRGEQGFQAR